MTAAVTAAPQPTNPARPVRAAFHDPGLLRPISAQRSHLLRAADMHITPAVPSTAAGRRGALAGSVGQAHPPRHRRSNPADAARPRMTAA